MDYDDGPLHRLAFPTGDAASALLLRLHPGSGPKELTDRLAAVGERVRDATDGNVAVEPGDGIGPPATPALTMVSRGRDVAHWLAVPQGPEEAPFVDLLLRLADPSSGSAAPPLVATPVALTVFVAAACPNCPHQVRAATTLAARDPSLTVSIVDIELFPDWAEQVGVRSVPTTVAEGGLTIVGSLSVDELQERIVNGCGPASEHVILASLLESSRTAAAAERLRMPAARVAFADLWGTSSLESRIGLLLAAEIALAADEAVLDDLAPPLAAALDDPHPSRRGDTADLLGRIAHPSARARLRLLLRDPDPDVVEMVEEALESIDRREAG